MGAPARNHASGALVLFLAVRALRENPLSVVLLVLAVAAGVTFQIPNVANLAGYRAELLEQEISAGLGHVRIRPRAGDRFHDAGELIAVARGIPGVEDVRPLLVLPGSLGNRRKLTVVQVSGVDPAAPHRPFEIVEGQDLSDADPSGVVLGTNLASRLNVRIGDTLQVQLMLAVQPRVVLDDEGIGNYEMHVRGLIGLAGVDHIFVDYRFMAEELGEDRPANVVLVYAANDSITLARRIARHIESRVPFARADAWLDDSRLIRSSVGAIEAVGNIAALMSLLAVGIPVLALLYIDALHRGRQVALLSAVGFDSQDVFKIFLAKAVLIGVIGVVMGLLAGNALLIYFDHHPIYDYDKFVIRPVRSLLLLLRPAAEVFLVTVLAGTYPAWRASRTPPSAMLRRIE